MVTKPTIPESELEQKALELYERSQTRETVKVIQEIDRRTGNVLSTKIIQPTVYSSPKAAKNALKGLRTTKKKQNSFNDIVEDISAIRDFENSAKFTEDEKQFLRTRKVEYEDYFIFDTPFEKNLLRYLLLEEMNLYRLYERMSTAKSGDEVDGRITRAVKRLSTLASDLKIKRETEKNNKEESGFSKLAKDYDAKDGQTIDKTTRDRWTKEEESLLNRHREVADDFEQMIEVSEDDEEEEEPEF